MLILFRSPLSPFTRAMDLGLWIYHHVGMPTPQISPHSHNRQEVTNEDRLPSQSMEYALREHHGSSQEKAFKEDKEKQHTKSVIGIVLCQSQERCGKATNEHKR